MRCVVTPIKWGIHRIEFGGEMEQVQGRTADQWGQIVRVAIGAARAVRRAVRGDSRAFLLTSLVSRIKLN